MPFNPETGKFEPTAGGKSFGQGGGGNAGAPPAEQDTGPTLEDEVADTASQFLEIAAEAQAAGIEIAGQQMALARDALRLNAQRASRHDALLAESLEQQARFAEQQMELSQAQFGLTERAFELQEARFGREEEQARLQELLRPVLLEQAGIIAQRDEEGNITGFEVEDDPMQQQREEVEQALLDRSLAALRGELPVNPALLRDLADQESNLREGLRKQLGPDFETSTPGIEALSEFEQRRTETLESARRGDISMAEQLGVARGQSNQQRVSEGISRGLTITNPATATQAQMAGLSFGQLPSVAQLFPQQQASFPGADLLNAGSQFGAIGADLQSMPLRLQNRIDVAHAGGGGGSDPFGQLLSTAGIAAAAYFSHSSSKDVGDDVDTGEVLDMVKDLGLKKWIYKGDDQTHIGPMAEDFHKSFGVGREEMIHVADVSGVTLAGIKALAERMEQGFIKVKIDGS